MQTQADLGWFGPDPIDIRVTNRVGSAVAVGDVVALDVGRSDGDSSSTTQTPGDANSGICNVVSGASATISIGPIRGLFGAVLVAAGDNVKTTIRMKGRVDACSLSGTVVLATGLVTPPVSGSSRAAVVNTSSGNTGAASAVLHKVIFIPLTARTGAGVTDGLFDGVNGFGMILV